MPVGGCLRLCLRVSSAAIEARVPEEYCRYSFQQQKICICVKPFGWAFPFGCTIACGENTHHERENHPRSAINREKKRIQ